MQLPKYQKMWKEGLASRFYYPDEIRLRDEAHYLLRLCGTGWPTQVVWGDSDGTATLDRGIMLYEMIAERQSRAYLNVFTAAGHYPYRDHPNYFSELMFGFLGQLPADGGRH